MFKVLEFFYLAVQLVGFQFSDQRLNLSPRQ